MSFAYTNQNETAVFLLIVCNGNALTYRRYFSKEKAMFVSAKSFARGIAEAEMSFAGKL